MEKADPTSIGEATEQFDKCLDEMDGISKEPCGLVVEIFQRIHNYETMDGQ